MIKLAMHDLNMSELIWGVGWATHAFIRMMEENRFECDIEEIETTQFRHEDRRDRSTPVEEISGRDRARDRDRDRDHEPCRIIAF